MRLRAVTDDNLEDVGLQQLEISTKREQVTTEAIRALADQGVLYQRCGVLVHVVRHDEDDGGISRSPNAPKIVAAPALRVAELLTRARRLVKFDARSRGWVPCGPPDWLGATVLARGSWPGVPEIRGIVEVPVMRADGSVLDRPGFDHQSGLLFAPNVDVPPIASEPTMEDAFAALARLRFLVADFPFATEGARSAWIAALLTQFCRHSFDGPVPLTLIDGNNRGAGKSRLADAIGKIATGRAMPRMAPVTDDAEDRKRITSIALAGDERVLIDNQEGPLGSAALDAVITGRSWSDRVLGSNTYWTGPISFVLFCSGNNVELKGDMIRRVLHVRLDSPLENPEERTGFRIEEDFDEYVGAHRGELAHAALTLLRAYHVAGRPAQPMKPWGSFEAWSTAVRAPLVWLGQVDPAETRKELRQHADREGVALHALMDELDALSSRAGFFTVSSILHDVTLGPMGASGIGAALTELIPTAAGHAPSAVKVGKLLQRLKNRCIGGRAIAQLQSAKSGARWVVQRVEGSS